MPQPEKWYISAPPAERPVTFLDVTTHLRLGETEGVSYVERLIDAATDYAQDRTALALMAQTITATFYDGEQILLPRGPLIEIDSVTDAGGNEVTAYDLRHVGRSTFILPAGAPARPLVVVYQAGHATAAEIPASVRLALLCHIGTLYENRESTGEKPRTPVPHSLDDFYRLKGRGTGIG